MRVICAVAALLVLAACAPPAPHGGELLLSNPDPAHARVQTVVTKNQHCAWQGKGETSAAEFWLPGGATQFIAAPPGADVCWRRAATKPAPGEPKWLDWNRALTASGRVIDSDL